MASTYSDLKIELIGTGEQSGTWGITTNTNLGTALEEAIVGRANANFTSDADLTLTLTNTNATQVARHFILNVTSGVSLSTTRNLIVPTIDKPYLIENNTTGGQSIIVKTAAGAGVTVPNGKDVFVYANGTDVVSAINHIPALSLTTDLAVTDGGTGASDAATAQTNLNVPSRTGAGASGTWGINVSGSAATLTTARSINGTSFNGSADITTANWGTARTLWGQSVNGSADITGALRPAAGSAITPAYSTFADTNTGVFFPSADTIAISTNGLERARISSTGLFSCVQGLQVTGNIDNINGAVRATPGSASTPAFAETGDTNTGMFFPAADTIAFSEGGVEAMRITSTGNVGIGTTVPSDKLDVGGNATITGDGTDAFISLVSTFTRGYLAHRSGSLTTELVNAQNGPITISTNSLERIRIHASGGVSIGNTTDSGLSSLNVSGSLSGGYIAHANGTTAMAFGTDNVVRVTPTANATYTTTVPAAGAICVLSILTSGTTSRTITFGTGFKATGTLATGTTSGRYFNITFVSDGSFLIEMSRTVAIA